MQKVAGLVLRGGTWHLVRRIPKRYKTVDKRAMFSASLDTDSRSAAERKASEVWERQCDFWQAKLDGHAVDERRAFEAVRKVAQSRGYAYLPVDQVAALPDAELLARVEAVSGADAPDPDEMTALMGTAKEPALKFSEVYDAFYALTPDRRMGKSDEQIRKWGNPYKRALNRWIEVNGDGDLTAARREDFLSFRAHWIEKIDTDRKSNNSANSEFQKLTNMLNTVIDGLGLDFVLPLPKRNWRLPKVEDASPPPFSTDWIKSKLLAPGALDGMNPEARAIFLICLNTGARPSEIATLQADRIVLDANVPHVQIRPDGRKVKTKRSVRDIPLLGVALEAARQFHEGFPRYRDNPASLSAAQLKYLRTNGLMESEDHVIYSLRHAFEDRMLEAGFSERVKADLMGHDIDRERYGKGASLDQTAALMEAIVF